jgi:transposase-like protein
MRDINDDLHKHPFDLELRSIAQDFARLLRPMAATIDRHGLRKRFLSKHVADVDKFYSRLSQGTLTSEVALGYEKRFVKYRGKLFLFLKYNDVPWNNNNAENAIRAFGELREIIKGSATEKGLREYLVLLSICETCKRRGVSFLEFLLSEETNIDTFAARRTSHLRGSVREGKREKGQQPRLLRGSSGDRSNASAGPWETSLHRRDNRNVPERNGERAVNAPKFGSPVEEQRESVVLPSGGPALKVLGASGEYAGRESDANSIKVENLGSGRRHSIPTFTSHDEPHSGAGASVLPDGRNPECTLIPCRGRSVRPQLHPPIFPGGVTPITEVLNLAKQDGQVTYFSGQLPVFSHPEDDLASFRMITSQFCVNGGARQSDIIRVFGVTPISVKRSVKIYREKGPKGFYARRATRGPAVLVDAVVAQAEERLAEGCSVAEVAAELGVKLNTLQKAIRAGRIRAAVKK